MPIIDSTLKLKIRQPRKVAETLAKLNQIHDELNAQLYANPTERPAIQSPSDASEIVNAFIGSTFQDYCQIKPGTTGLWQVSGRNHTTFSRRAELDMEYIQRWSF